MQAPAEKPAVSETSLETELESFIDSSADETIETPSSVKLELEVFRLNAQKGKYLSLLFDPLKMIKPSTVDVERLFSSAGLLVSRLRTRLGNDSIDKVMFIRANFSNKPFIQKKKK